MSNSMPVLFSPGVGNQGMTELHFAAYCGDRVELERCLKAGMDPNQKDEYRGYTALLWLADMAAAGGPRMTMFRMLVRYDVDIHARSNDGISALTLAKEAGSQAGDKLAVALRKLGVNESKKPNKAPEPTTMAVTIRAPSSTARASHGRGSS